MMLSLFRLVPGKWVLLLGVAALGGYYVFQAGNQYGTYAREYHKIVRELEQKNEELLAQKTEDEKALREATRARDDAVAAAKGLTTCKATKEHAKRINAVKE